MDLISKIIVLIELAFAVSAASTPTDFMTFKPLDLSLVVNRTVCPIEVKIHEDLDRIPKRIKHLKCAGDVNQWCSEINVPKNECCHHNPGAVSISCVEVEDKVMVYFPKVNQTQSQRVSVGCLRVMEESVQVPEAKPERSNKSL